MPKQLEEHGLTAAQIELTETRCSRRSSRVHARGRACATSSARLRRSAARSARQVAEGRSSPAHLTSRATLAKFLGARSTPPRRELERRRVGVATGLAWTPVRRRHPVHRGHRHARARAGPDPHRPARRRDAGVGPGGAVLRPRTRAGAGHRAGLLRPASISTSTCPRAPFPRTARPRASRWRRRSLPSLTGRPAGGEVAMTGEITLRGRISGCRRRSGETTRRRKGGDRIGLHPAVQCAGALGASGLAAAAARDRDDLDARRSLRPRARGRGAGGQGGCRDCGVNGCSSTRANAS